VEGHRCDEHHGRQCRGHQRHHIDGDVESVQFGEALGERHAEQEREQDLHAGEGDPQFLQQLGQIAVEELVKSLAARIR
jgi:hypothetical protein